MTEGDIQEDLYRVYTRKDKSMRYCIENVYLFLWESDFLTVTKSGYVYEFEIKCTRADFAADKKKIRRHEILENGWYMRKRWIREGTTVTTGFEKKETSHRPNKFFYVVPKDLIKVTEVPEYAGLIYYTQGGKVGELFEVVKPAPVIHRIKLDVEKRLCQKYYYKYINCRTK